MKKRYPYYILSFVVPHIMLIVGIVFLSKNDPESKIVGLKICKLSAAVMIVGSLIYYILFTPLFGLD